MDIDCKPEKNYFTYLLDIHSYIAVIHWYILPNSYINIISILQNWCVESAKCQYVSNTDMLTNVNKDRVAMLLYE